jgi:hypothetical protein
MGIVRNAESARNAETAVNVQTARTAARVSNAVAASVRRGRVAIVVSVRLGPKVSSGSAQSVRTAGTGIGKSGRPEDARTSRSNLAGTPMIGVRIRQVAGPRRGSSGGQIVPPSARVQAGVG